MANCTKGCDLGPRLARIETMVAQVRAVAVVLGIAAGALAITASWSVKHMLLDALNDDGSEPQRTRLLGRARGNIS